MARYTFTAYIIHTLNVRSQLHRTSVLTHNSELGLTNIWFLISQVQSALKAAGKRSNSPNLKQHLIGRQ